MFRSLRWRLQAWHTLILLLVVAGLGGMLYAETSRARFDEIDGELLAAARVLEGVLRTFPGVDHSLSPRRFPPGPESPRRNRRPPVEPGRFDGPSPRGPGFLDGPPPGQRPRPPRDAGPPGHRLMPMRPPPNGPRAFSLPNSLMDRYVESGEPPYFVIRSALGEVIREDPPGIAVQAPVDSAVGRRYESHSRNRGVFREVTLLGPGRTTILVGRPIHHELAAMRWMAWRIGLMGFGVFSAGMIGGWWLSSRAVRPIVAMSETVAGINASSLSRRLDLESVDTELGRLGDLINNMLARLGRSFEQQARFTADASHELRTPLAVILSQVELALSRPRDGPAYRESLEACGRAALRMKLLVDDLLTLARADSGKLELRVESIDLARIAEESAALLEPLAQKRAVCILPKTCPAPLKGDPERLGQVLTNLLSNAIQYNQPGGQVVVSVRSDDDSATVVVEDTGVGIPKSDLPLVFDRFHRVDAARSRASGGSGLGLAICLSIVEAHGGTITVSSVVDRGSRFTVKIPHSYNGGGPNLVFGFVAPAYDTPSDDEYLSANTGGSTMRAKGANGVGRFSVEIEIANYGDLIRAQDGNLPADQVRRETIKGVVDSGATRLVLPEVVVKRLGLPLGAAVNVRYANGRRARRRAVKGVFVQLLGRDSVFTAISEPKRDTALIGAIVLEDLDLLVDCVAQQVIPRDPRGETFEIE